VKLQKASLFALYAVLELAADPARQLSAAEIAERYGISGHHLAKVLRQLVNAGLIQAVRGVGGGYRFAGNARRITLLDVIEPFERIHVPLEQPDTAAPEALRVLAGLQGIAGEIDELTRAVLDAVSLATLLEQAGRAPAGDRTAPGRRPRR
jgi:Rrf2 family protein